MGQFEKDVLFGQLNNIRKMVEYVKENPESELNEVYDEILHEITMIKAFIKEI